MPFSFPSQRVAAALAVGVLAVAGLGLTIATTAAASPQSTPPPSTAMGGVPGQCATTHWVAAWTASPSGLLAGGFTNQTLRVILAPHVGGDQLRIHLSNRFGMAAVKFAGASVGLRQAGAALAPGSVRQLTFGGRPGITVEPGGEAVSDPASLTVVAFQDLAVSLYFARGTGPATGHLVARERSYVTGPAAGDHSADPGAGAFPDSITTIDFVDAVDILGPSDVGAAVLFGDSITDGYESSGPSGAEDQAGIDLNHRYPDYLAHRALDLGGGSPLSIVNAGISGNRVVGDPTALGGPSAVSRLDSDVLGLAAVTDAIVLEGINDIGGQTSAADVTDGLAQIVVRLHAAGVHVLLGTITPAGTGLLNLAHLLPGLYLDSPGNAARVAVNTWIRSGASGADGVVDFDAALRGAAIPNELDPNFDSGDHLHPNDLGYARMAGTVDLHALRGARCAERRATTLRLHARARAAGGLRISGKLLGPAPGECSASRVIVRAMQSGRTILRRRLTLSAACDFAARRPIGGPGRIEIRASFAGSAALAPATARAMLVRTR